MQKIPMSGGGEPEPDVDPIQNPEEELRTAADAPEGATGSEILASGGDPLAASKTLTKSQTADVDTAIRVAEGTMRANDAQGNDPTENVRNTEQVMSPDDSSPTDTSDSGSDPSPTDSSDPTSEKDNKRSDKSQQDSVQAGDSGARRTIVQILNPGQTKKDGGESQDQGVGLWPLLIGAAALLIGIGIDEG